jgi:hypothetical protein
MLRVYLKIFMFYKSFVCKVCALIWLYKPLSKGKGLCVKKVQEIGSFV